MEDDLNVLKMEDDLNVLILEDDHNILMNGNYLNILINEWKINVRQLGVISVILKQIEMKHYMSILENTI